MILFCPRCGSEFGTEFKGEWFSTGLQCPGCGVALSEPPPPLAPSDREIEYVLEFWSAADRAVVTEALAEAGFQYRWSAGLVLTVPERAEDEVNGVLGDLSDGPVVLEVEEFPVVGGLDGDEPAVTAGGTAPRWTAADWSLPGNTATGDAPADDVAAGDSRGGYATGGDATHDGGEARLVEDEAGDATHDGGVDEAGEDEAGLEAGETGEDGVGEDSEDGGEEAHSAMEDLFVAADRLQHAPGDATVVFDLVEASEIVGACRPPFGIEREVWAHIQQLAAAAAEAGLDQADDETVASDARTLRDFLRAYV